MSKHHPAVEQLLRWFSYAHLDSIHASEMQ